MKRESTTIEYKETPKISTYLKTVSAYANYGTGQIIFGIRDDHQVVGLPDPPQACLDIENRINDSLHPVPQYRLRINPPDQTVTLIVYQGDQTPYRYKGKTYCRNDPATVVINDYELNQLILAGQHLNFEDLAATDQQLQFTQLDAELKQRLKLNQISPAIFKTLDLYTDDDQYNNTAAILADHNHFPGIDIARFGETTAVIRNRQQLTGVSVLTQLHGAMRTYRQYYQYELLVGATRETRTAIPEVAFREALANCLVHRAWDIPVPVRIALFEDRIELASPGGLPTNVNPEEYLHGQGSILRNPKLAGVLFRLRYIEQFGTGISKILAAYEEFPVQPDFQISANAIRVILPLTTVAENDSVANTLLARMAAGHPYSRADLEQQSGLTKNQVIRLLHQLLERKKIARTGAGRATRYLN